MARGTPGVTTPMPIPEMWSSSNPSRLQLIKLLSAGVIILHSGIESSGFGMVWNLKINGDVCWYNKLYTYYSFKVKVSAPCSESLFYLFNTIWSPLPLSIANRSCIIAIFFPSIKSWIMPERRASQSWLQKEDYRETSWHTMIGRCMNGESATTIHSIRSGRT